MRAFDSRLDEITKLLRVLPDKPEETPQSTLCALWLKAAGSPMSADRSLTEKLPELDAPQLTTLDLLIEERLAGVPLGHLTGRQSFMGLELLVGPDALLPRRETEILCRAALAVVAGAAGRCDRPLIVDTCCGCGNVALALAHSSPNARIIGIDLSPEAIVLARANTEQLGLSDRVEFRVGDLLSPVKELAGRLDLITCNPPYISTATVGAMDGEISDHEPSMAFDGGSFGVAILRRLPKEAAPLLRTGGHFAFEVGAGQGESISTRLERMASIASVKPHRDQSNTIRAIVAEVE